MVQTVGVGTDIDDGDTTRDYSSSAALFKALANPLRLRIVDRLADNPMCVHELVDCLGAEQPLVSQHLRVLRDARVIRATRRGREMEYSLDDEHVAHIVADAITHGTEQRTPDTGS